MSGPNFRPNVHPASFFLLSFLQVRGRCLVCADGATSRLATKLGYCTEAPEGVCTRAFVKGGTHNTNFDGVCFYPRESLPGYAAIFKHPNDELNFCYYLIPTGKNGQCGGVKESDLARLHNEALTKDPFISKALGDKFEIERMRAASLRLGGQVRLSICCFVLLFSLHDLTMNLFIGFFPYFLQFFQDF